jgi:recombination protein RecA
LEIVELLARSGAVDVIVVDSVAALVPKAEIEGEMGDQHVGLQARLMSQALRKLTAVLYKSNTAAIFINQIREKVGAMYTNPETTPGGRALKFYSSVRLDVRKSGPPIKAGNEAVGIKVKVKVVKNKLAPPFREAELEIYFGRGLDPVMDLVNVAVAAGVIEKAGSWFSYGEHRLGQGKEKAAEYLRERPELLEEIRAKVLERADQVVLAAGEEEGE